MVGRADWGPDLLERSHDGVVLRKALAYGRSRSCPCREGLPDKGGSLVAERVQEIPQDVGVVPERVLPRSRTLGEDNAPKTAGSEWTITVGAAMMKLLAGLKPLHAADEDFVLC